MSLTVEWVKPELDTDPNHWVLRVTGEDFETYDLEGGEKTNEQNDLSLMWYVATPDDALATFDTDHIHGSDQSFGVYNVIMPSPVVQVGPIPRDWWRCRARGALKVSKYYINKTVTTYSTGLSGREGKPLSLSLRHEVVPRTHPRK